MLTAIRIHTSATSALAQRHARLAGAGGVCGRAYIYVDGALVASARAATDELAVKEAVKQFRLTRAERRRERAAAPTSAAQLPPI